MKKLIYLFLLTIIASGCTITRMHQHLVVVESEQGTRCSVKYSNDIVRKKANSLEITTTGDRFAFQNSISTLTTGNYKVLEELEYTLTRIEGDGTCTMYIVRQFTNENDSIYGQLFHNPLPGGNTLTDEQMAWVKQNATAACTIDPKETSDEVVVKL